MIIKNVRFAFVLIAVVFAMLFTTTACSTPEPIENPPLLTFYSNQLVKNPPPEDTELLIPSSNNTGWERITAFTGTGNDTTSLFPISGGTWRICWAIDSIYPDYAVFDVFIYREDEPNTFTYKFSNTGNESGTVLIELDSGTYYMKVIATNLYRWSIAVEDFTPLEQDFPVQITHINHKGRDFLETIKINEDIIEADEYIEISNVSDTPQSITGWKLKNVTRGYPVFTFPSYYPYCYSFNSDDKEYTIAPLIPCVLEPYQSVRVYTGEVHHESGGFCYYYLPGDIWNNTEPDTAVLYSSHNVEASRRSYFISEMNK